MSSEARQLLSTFEALSPAAQHEAAVQILRKTAEWDLDPLSDDDLVRAADELFVELDCREEQDGT